MKHMKSILSVLLAVLMVCSVCVSGATVFAEGEKETQIGTLTIPATPATTRAARFADDAQLLTAEEAAALLNKLDETSERLQFDIVIVTAKNTGSRKRNIFAWDYYEYNGFGYGEEKDGSLLLLSMAEPGWSGYDSGSGWILNSDYFIQVLEEDEFTALLNSKKYYDAFVRYVQIIEDFMTEAKTGKPYDESNPYPSKTAPATDPTTPTTPAEVVPTWKWESENRAVATFVTNDGKSTTNLSCSKEEGTITETRNANGDTVYTATVSFGGKTYTDTYTVPAPAPTFVYNEPTWEWNGENLAVATFVSTDGTDTQTVTAKAEDGMITGKTDESGKTVYTATVTFGGKTYTDTYTGGSSGLSFGAPTWNWDSNESALATFVSTDGSAKVSVSASKAEGTIVSTTKANGDVVYTATVTFEGRTYTDNRTVPAGEQPAADGFRAPTWVWENESLARATFVSTDGSAKISVSASADEGTIKRSQKSNGDVVYTATVTFQGKTYTDSRTVPASGTDDQPSYAKPTWTWNGVKSATATFVGKNGAKTKKVTATVKNGGIVSKTKGTCGNKGKTTYIATVTFRGKTYKNKITKAIDHKWKTELNPATMKAAGSKIFTCTVCSKRVNNPIAKIAKVSLSKAKYTADGKTHTPKVIVKDANGKTLKKNKAYTVAYQAGRKEVGVYTVTVTFKGLYYGTKVLKMKVLPNAPEAVTATPADGKATITWKAVPGATQYYVYCMRDGGKSFFQCATVHGTSAEIGSLKNGTTYLFKVRAVYPRDNNTTWVGPACKAVRVTPAATAPAQPTTQPAN